MSEEKRIDRIERIAARNAKGLEELRLARVEDQSKMDRTFSFMEETVSKIQSENAQTLSKIQSENAQTLSKIQSQNAQTLSKIQSQNAQTLSKIQSEHAQIRSKIQSENAKNLADNAKAREDLRRYNAHIFWKIIAGYAVGGAIAALIAIHSGMGQSSKEDSFSHIAEPPISSAMNGDEKVPVDDGLSTKDGAR